MKFAEFGADLRNKCTVEAEGPGEERRTDKDQCETVDAGHEPYREIVDPLTGRMRKPANLNGRPSPSMTS